MSDLVQMQKRIENDDTVEKFLEHGYNLGTKDRQSWDSSDWGNLFSAGLVKLRSGQFNDICVDKEANEIMLDENEIVKNLKNELAISNQEKESLESEIKTLKQQMVAIKMTLAKIKKSSNAKEEKNG